MKLQIRNKKTGKLELIETTTEIVEDNSIAVLDNVDKTLDLGVPKKEVIKSKHKNKK